ncbi:GntR family transcriptional regulator MpaR [Pseudomonas sp. Marseille-QA0892]
MKLYEKLADDIAGLIRAGTLSPGEKVPSVRHASRAYNVSPSTVFQAYYLLEDRGLISARARSGYFVRPRTMPTRQAPVITASGAATEVGVSELVFSVLGALCDPHTVPFGAAFPSPELLPLTRLGRSMSHAVRDMSGPALVAKLTAGHPDLIRQIALRYGVNGVALRTEELVVTNGAMEALSLCLKSVTEPGDLVAIEAPAFYATLQALERLKLKAVEIPVHPRDGLDLEVLANRLDTLPIKACWFMPHLQNPTGASLSEVKKRALCELITRHQVPLIENDVYAELYFGATPPRPVKHFDREGWVMHCSSFSKALAPGYRVGWVAAGRFAERVNRLRLMTTVSASVPAQMAIADYLQHGSYDRHLRKLRQALKTQQDRMLDAAARYFPAETRVSRPAGGYYLWFEFPAHVDALALFHLAMAQGISIAPGPIFSASQHFGHCVRLNYGHPWNEESERAMRTLGELLRSGVISGRGAAIGQ